MEYYHSLKSWHIKGNVDSIVQNRYGIKNSDSSQTNVDSKEVSFYNKDGLLLERRIYPYATIREYHMVNAKPMRDINKYDDAGNLLETINHSSSGAPIWKYTFNSSPSLIEVKSYYVQYNSLATTAKLSLDKKGNIIDVSSYDGSSTKLSYHHRYQYDDDNNCVEDIEISQETLYEYKTIKLYANGDLIKEVNYNEHRGVEATYNYVYTKYDENHNWMEQKVYFNGKLSRIEERTIIYRK